MSPLKRHTISFRNAFNGIRHTVVTQPNLRIHFLIAALVVMAGIYFGLSQMEWLIILFTIMWVIVSEMLNTSIEAMVDLIAVTKHEEARVAKDVAAGMVLVGAIGSIIVAGVIFLPKIVDLI